MSTLSSAGTTDYGIFGTAKSPERQTMLDQILSGYSEKRRRIREFLDGDSGGLLALWGELLTVDTECQSKMTPRNRMQACKHCEDLGYLFDLDVDKAFVLECGRFIGRTLIVRRPTDEPAKMEFDGELVVQGDRILSFSPLLGKCGFTQVDRYLTCDSMSAEILMRIAFNEIFISPITFITAFHCETSRYLVEIYAKSWNESIAEIKKLTMNQSHDIFVQLVAGLYQLSDYQTILGELDGRSIFIKNDPPSITYENVHIKGPFGVSFGYTPGSSMTVGDTRICSVITPKVVASVHPKIHIFLVAIEKGKVCTAYSLDAGTRTTFLRHRRSGIPLYPGSLELYITLITISCTKKFFDLLMNNYREVWTRLWLGQGDLEIVTTKILEWQAAEYQPIHDEIIDLLLGRWLRCDALDLMWEHIGHHLDLRHLREN